MLNYIWTFLIVLGITSALYFDISDLASDKYQNGKQIQGALSALKDNKDSANSAKRIITISPEAATSFFHVPIHDAVVFDAILNNGKVDSVYKVNLILHSNSQDFIKKIAAASGDDNDISASIVFLQSASNGAEQKVQIEFEKVSFTKLNDVTSAVLKYAEKSVTIALGLIGVMCLWLGVMKIAEAAGMINLISKLVTPFMRKLFPEVPENHPAIGAMIMNISANFLGLGNAATPFGLKAMEELDKLNPKKGTATNAMCMFLTINTAGLTLIPATAIALRASAGSSDPSFIIATSLFASSCATIMGILSAKVFEIFPLRISLVTGLIRRRGVSVLLFSLVASAIIYLAKHFIISANALDLSPVARVLQVFSVIAIPGLIIIFVIIGVIKKIKVYEQFIEGAKEGFNIAVKIIPYLVAMLCAIGIFRAGGAMEILISGLRFITEPLGMPPEALPMALMRPLSGSGSLGVMAETMSVHGADSFIGKLVSTLYGSSETTFYVLAVYFGSVQIKNTRHALASGLIADIAGVIGALFIVRLLCF